MNIPNLQCARRRFLAPLVSLTLLGLGAAHFTAKAADYAPIMPKALTSTMIDADWAGQRLVAVGERGHVLYSADRGQSWTQAKVPFRRMLTGVHFADDALGWAVGHQSMVFQTTDGGVTWTRQLDGFALQQQYNEDNLERTRSHYQAFAAEMEANPDPGRELELEDALFAFEDAELLLEEPPLPTNLHDVWFLDETTGWAVGSFGRLMQTRDGGENWAEISHLLDNPDGFHLNGVTGTADGEVFIAGEGGVLYRSLDRGETWEFMDAGYFDTFFGIVFDPVHRLLTTFGLGSALFQSADLGMTWQSLDSPAQATFAGGAVTGKGQTVLVGPAGMVLVIDGASGAISTHVQRDRGNFSTVLPLDDETVLVVGTGGPRLVSIK